MNILTIGARTKVCDGRGQKADDQDPAFVWGKEACANLHNLLIDTMRWLRTLTDAAILDSGCIVKEVGRMFPN